MALINRGIDVEKNAGQAVVVVVFLKNAFLSWTLRRPASVTAKANGHPKNNKPLPLYNSLTTVCLSHGNRHNRRNITQLKTMT